MSFSTGSEFAPDRESRFVITRIHKPAETWQSLRSLTHFFVKRFKVTELIGPATYPSRCAQGLSEIEGLRPHRFAPASRGLSRIACGVALETFDGVFSKITN